MSNKPIQIIFCQEIAPLNCNEQAATMECIKLLHFFYGGGGGGGWLIAVTHSEINLSR